MWTGRLPGPIFPSFCDLASIADCQLDVCWVVLGSGPVCVFCCASIRRSGWGICTSAALSVVLLFGFQLTFHCFGTAAADFLICLSGSKDRATELIRPNSEKKIGE